jgi:DNA-binding Xre family transcriptional regulator
MISLGFSARHWQQIEAGRPITLRTLLKICDTFGIQAGQLIVGLDRGVYKK